MRLDEIFFEPSAKQAHPLKDRLQQAVIDFLTPLIAHKVPFVSVQQVIDDLRATRPGVLIDRAFIMSMLDPDQVKAVQKIEGDRIYLQQPEEADRAIDDDDAQKEVDKIKDRAKQQAQKDVKEPAPGS